jgi:predicted transposase YdaD
MGGKVLELYSEKLLRRGEARGKKDGIAEGEARGEAKGTLMTLCSLVKKGLLSVADAAKELGVSEEAFKKMAML